MEIVLYPGFDETDHLLRWAYNPCWFFCQKTWPTVQNEYPAVIKNYRQKECCSLYEYKIQFCFLVYWLFATFVIMNWPLPDLNEDCLDFKDVNFKDNLLDEKSFSSAKQIVDAPNRNRNNEWDIDWPELAPVDINFPWDDCSRVNLIDAKVNIWDQIYRGSVLAYYVPYVYLTRTFQRKMKSQGTHEEILAFNNTLPQHIRYGIHLCHNNILNYAQKVIGESTDAAFNRYTLALLFKFILAHEWGHYRAEINLIQQNLYLYAVRNKIEISTLSYYRFTALKMAHANFEEVFADYCGLKYGIFNVKFNDLQSGLGKSKKVKSLKDSLARCIFHNDNSPYGDVRYWINNEIDINKTISTYLEQPKYANKLIQIGHLSLQKDKTFLKTQLLDVLTHNQNQFIRGKSPNIFGSKSARLSPEELNTSWHHVTRDPIQIIPNLTNKDNIAIDCNHIQSPLIDVIKQLGKSPKNKPEYVKMPLLSVPELLRIGPVMIEQY